MKKLMIVAVLLLALLNMGKSWARTEKHLLSASDLDGIVISVLAGHEIHIIASGLVHTNPFGNLAGCEEWAAPGGLPDCSYTEEKSEQLHNLPFMALIGELNGEYFLIGSSFTRVFQNDGELHLIVNDWLFSDNDGFFMLEANIIAPDDTDGDGIPNDEDSFPRLPIQKGDINNDGSVDVKDAVLALQSASNTASGPVLFKEADADGDGDIGIKEALLALQVDSELRPQTWQVGSDESTLRLENLEINIPSNTLAGPVEISTAELSSQATEVANYIDPSKMHPIGKAYKIDAPFQLDEPITINLSYLDSDIPQGFAAGNLVVFLRLEGPPGTDSREPMFIPMPSQVDEQNKMVSADILGGGTYQLALLSHPLQIETDSVPPIPGVSFTKASAGPSPPYGFKFVWTMLPTGWGQSEKDGFKAQVLAGLNPAYYKYVQQWKLPAPLPTNTYISVARIPKEDKNIAFVDIQHPHIIVVDPIKILNHEAPIHSNMAHEYFHVIQFFNSNYAHINEQALIQVALDNIWFEDGTADWAMDEVFDTVPGHYVSPKGTRFIIPLNTNEVSEDESYAYETVAFWKWLGLRQPGAIPNIIFHHRFLTHNSTSPPVRNSKPVRYLDSVTHLYPRLEFLKFAADALYWKNFDTNETGKNDLWDEDFLGKPNSKDLPKDLNVKHLVVLREGEPGDGKQNKKDITYKLRAHLTAEAFKIKNSEGEDALCGTLHIEFEEPDDPAAKKFVATAISRDTHKQKNVTLSTAQELTFGFNEGSEVVVILADPQWRPPGEGSPFGYGDIKVWVESCEGSIENQFIVDSAQGFMSALDTAAAGDTILLEPGTYEVSSFTIDKDIIIAGAGKYETTLRVGSGMSYILVDKADAFTVRDLTLQGYIFAQDVRQVSLCDVRLYNPKYAVYYNPLNQSGKHVLRIHNSTLINQNGVAGNAAVVLENRSYEADKRSDFEVQIRNSIISGFVYGIHFWGDIVNAPSGGPCGVSPSGSVSLDFNCSVFQNCAYPVWSKYWEFTGEIGGRCSWDSYECEYCCPGQTEPAKKCAKYPSKPCQ